MIFEERALSFICHDSWLCGILSVPEKPLHRGVLIVVGGPQYRVGSHRQFTLLARHLAAHGVPVMRFDYRGMGDSEGDARNFEDVEDDIHHATDQFLSQVPAIKEVVIWALCDAACAALFYACRDPRISGLVLLNPWVRTEQGAAKTYLRHYYLARLFDGQVWRKVLRGSFDYGVAVQSIARLIGTALPRSRISAPFTNAATVKKIDNRAPLPERMLDGLACFKGNVLLIMSGNDLTAQEFLDLVKGSRDWQKQLGSPRVQRRDLPQANHTFSQRDWRDQVAAWTSEWIVPW